MLILLITVKAQNKGNNNRNYSFLAAEDKVI